jgi:hypothetical protein
MGVDYWADVDQGVTFTVWHGDVNADEATAHLLRLASDPEWPPGPRYLTDVTTAGNIDGAIDPHLLDVLVNGVATFQMAVLGAARAASMIQRSAKAVGTDATVFDDLAEACDWLGVDFVRARLILGAIRSELLT